MKISQLMQFHEDPRVIAWWLARFGVVLDWLTPFRRRAFLAAGSVVICLQLINREVKEAKFPFHLDQTGFVLAFAVLLGLSYLVYRTAANYAALPKLIRQHPQLILHSIYWGTLAIIWLSAPEAGRWRDTFVVVGLLFPFMIWRFGYVLMVGQYGRMGSTRFSDHYLAMWPAFGGTNTPVGNGIGFLSRSEAKNSEALARSQLAGIKLFILLGILKLIMNGWAAFIYGPGNDITTQWGGFTLGIPKLDQLVTTGGKSAPLWKSWLSVYCELIYQVLRHAINGHGVVALLRLFGFNVFRNTYKPLLAESIVEFWNRYYYYFKELMANFFFLPTFTRLGSHLRNWPNLRLLTAVFAAAFVGNTYYHLIKLNQTMVLGGVIDSLYALRSRIFYCFLLALGIFVSMYREQRRAGRPLASGRINRILRIAGVWTFFGLIFIWNVKGGGSFMNRVNFFFSLFGLA